MFIYNSIYRKIFILTGCLFMYCSIESPALAQTNKISERAARLNKNAHDLIAKEPVKSLEFSKKAFLEASRSGDKQQIAMAYENIGKANASLGQFNIAFDNLQKARINYKKFNLKSNEAAVLIALASVLNDQGNFGQALVCLDESMKLYTNLNDSNGIADVFRSKGSLEWKKNEFKQAIVNYQKAYAIASRNKNIRLAAQSLNGLGISYREMGDYNKANDFLQKSLRLNIEIKDSSRMGELYNLMGGLYQRTGIMNKALAYFDSACSIYLKAGYKKEYAKARRNTGIIYRDMKIPQKATESLQQALNIFTELKDTSEMARTLIQCSIISLNLKKYTDAHRDLLSALKLSIEANKISEVIETYNNLGLLFSETKNYSSSLEAHLKSVKYAREIADKNKLRYALTLEGNDYVELGQADLAYKAFRESYDISANLEDLREKALAGKNLARSESLLNHSTNAENLLFESLNDFEKLDFHAGVLQVLNELGNLFELGQQPAKAIGLYDKAIAKAVIWNEPYFISLCSRKAGEICMKNKDLVMAKNYFDKATEAGIKTGNKELLKNCWHSMADYFEINGDFVQALKYYHLYTLGKDSIEKFQQAEMLILKQANFEVSQKDSAISKIEQQVDVLEKERQIRELALNKKNIQRNFAVIAVFLLSLVLFLLWNRYKLKQKKENELNSNFQIIRETNRKLEESQKELQSLNASKDKFFSIIAHDIKNPLTGILGFGEHLSKNYKNLGREEIHEIADIINDASHNLYSLLDNLLSWSRLQTGRMVFAPIEFSAKDICLETLELQKVNAGTKNISIIPEFDESIIIFADINLFKLVVRNLLSNAVKFTNSNGTICITAIKENKMACISIEDNGIGMSDEEQLNLFRIESLFSTRGTANEEGTGLGLLLCKDCVEKNGGMMSVESKQGQGSKFTFTVPLKK